MKKLLYALLLFGCVQGCKDDCPIEPDPCAGYPEKMEILIKEINKLDANEYIDTPESTFMLNEILIFSTSYEYDSTIWQIGSDPKIYKENKVSVHFDKAYDKVIVTCVGYRPIDTACFGIGDNGIDTLYKQLEFRNWYESPLFGTYRGTNSGEADSFNVTLGLDSIYNQTLDKWFLDIGKSYYTGIPKSSTARRKIIQEYFHFWGYNVLTPDGLDPGYTFGKLLPEDRDVVEITYKMKNSSDEIVFRGRKIN